MGRVLLLQLHVQVFVCKLFSSVYSRDSGRSWRFYGVPYPSGQACVCPHGDRALRRWEWRGRLLKIYCVESTIFYSTGAGHSAYSTSSPEFVLSGNLLKLSPLFTCLQAHRSQRYIVLYCMSSQLISISPPHPVRRFSAQDSFMIVVCHPS